MVLAAAPVADLVKAYEMKVSDEGGGEDVIESSKNCVKACQGNDPVKIPRVSTFGNFCWISLSPTAPWIPWMEQR